MQSSPKRWTRVALISIAWVLAATHATASGIPGPQAPDVFSGDFGVMLADDQAGGSSALDQLGDLAGSSFPWNSGFAFPAELPPLPLAGLELDLPPGVAAQPAGRSQFRSVVPEPATGILMALGLMALGLSQRRRSA